LSFDIFEKEKECRAMRAVE